MHPAKGVEDFLRNSLDKAEDGRSKYLDGKGQDREGQEDECRDSVVESEHPVVRGVSGWTEEEVPDGPQRGKNSGHVEIVKLVFAN